ncbi:MAG TPA: intradiol ring-cleavage dioxygenase [Methylomirabilota bacterium]|nr:intradiol ring-cleavage dioxygenase [Methylomirabilota bacterium]
MRRVVASLAAVLALSVAPFAPAQSDCAPSRPDMLGPFYTPNAPERDRTGRGIVVSGAVRSTRGCAPLPGARLEWWSADTRGEYKDALRATQRADAQGHYRYETESPGRYPGRPPHLHVRITAPGHRPLVTQLYPKPAETTLAADFVLIAD